MAMSIEINGKARTRPGGAVRRLSASSAASAFPCLLALLLCARSAEAGNVDLTTLPPRQKVQLTIYNSEDLTLAKETRRITFKKGANAIQFSWANTLIDPTSLEFRAVKEGDKVQVVDATFPGDRPEVVVGWSETEAWRERIRNYKAKAVRFEIRRRYSGDVELSSGDSPKQEDAFTAEFAFTVDPGQTKDIAFDLLRKQGTSAKQNRLLVK